MVLQLKAVYHEGSIIPSSHIARLRALAPGAGATPAADAGRRSEWPGDSDAAGRDRAWRSARDRRRPGRAQHPRRGARARPTASTRACLPQVLLTGQAANLNTASTRSRCPTDRRSSSARRRTNRRSGWRGAEDSAHRRHGLGGLAGQPHRSVRRPADSRLYQTTPVLLIAAAGSVQAAHLVWDEKVQSLSAERRRARVFRGARGRGRHDRRRVLRSLLRPDDATTTPPPTRA